MNSADENCIFSHFNPVAIKSVTSMFDIYKNVPAFQRLTSLLSVEKLDTHTLIENGLGLLAPNLIASSSASAYFFVLSELQNLSQEVVDYLLDVSIYTGGTHHNKEYYKTFLPWDVYAKKIAPSLLDRPSQL